MGSEGEARKFSKSLFKHSAAIQSPKIFNISVDHSNTCSTFMSRLALLCWIEKKSYGSNLHAPAEDLDLMDVMMEAFSVVKPDHSLLDLCCSFPLQDSAAFCSSSCSA